MTQEDKELLLKDLCARLPYGVMIQIPELFYPQRKVAEKLVTIYDLWHFNDNGIYIENVKPYLRPMSSMTEEEGNEYRMFIDYSYNDFTSESTPCVYIDKIENYINWLNAHHFDYRGLIEKGLALEAPEGMYDLKKK